MGAALPALIMTVPDRSEEVVFDPVGAISTLLSSCSQEIHASVEMALHSWALEVTVTDLGAVSVAPKERAVGVADNETCVIDCVTEINTGSAFPAATITMADRSESSLFKLVGVTESVFPSCATESHETEGLAYQSALVVTVAVLAEVSFAEKRISVRETESESICSFLHEQHSAKEAATSMIRVFFNVCMSNLLCCYLLVKFVKVYSLNVRVVSHSESITKVPDRVTLLSAFLMVPFQLPSPGGW